MTISIENDQSRRQERETNLQAPRPPRISARISAHSVAYHVSPFIQEVDGVQGAAGVQELAKVFANQLSPDEIEAMRRSYQTQKHVHTMRHGTEDECPALIDNPSVPDEVIVHGFNNLNPFVPQPIIRSAIPIKEGETRIQRSFQLPEAFKERYFSLLENPRTDRIREILPEEFLAYANQRLLARATGIPLSKQDITRMINLNIPDVDSDLRDSGRTLTPEHHAQLERNQNRRNRRL